VLEFSGLVGRVFLDDISLVHLKVSEANEDNVTLSGYWDGVRQRTTLIQTFFLIFPRIWHKRRVPSKQFASKRPLPTILIT
jgi:hypothetical protein